MNISGYLCKDNFWAKHDSPNLQQLIFDMIVDTLLTTIIFPSETEKKFRRQIKIYFDFCIIKVTTTI